MSETQTSIRFEVKNTDNHDFENCRTSFRLTHPDGTAVHWTLPDRLVQHIDMQVVHEQMLEELEVRRRVRRNTPWLFGDSTYDSEDTLIL